MRKRLCTLSGARTVDMATSELPHYLEREPQVCARNVGDGSFEVQIEAWDYLDGTHVEKELAYISAHQAIQRNISEDKLAYTAGSRRVELKF